MHIKKIQLPKSVLTNDLKGFDLTGLEKTVLISGKNGSGKTRFLHTIEAAIKGRNMRENGHRSSLRIFPANSQKLSRFEKEYDADYKNMADKISQIGLTIKTDKTNYSAIWPAPVWYVPKLGNWQKTVESLTKLAKDFCDNIENEYVSAANTEQRISITKAFESLSSLIFDLLGLKIEIVRPDRLVIGEEYLSNAIFSDGQKCLLELAYRLSLLETEGLMIFLDEPENHLHPEASIKLIQKLIHAEKIGQVWISTHSIPIISYFYPKATLLFANDGKIGFSGNIPQKVFKSLIGDSERTSRLIDFVNLPDQYAAINFAAECFYSPDVHELNDGGTDPQASQIIDILESKYSGQLIKLLDFGAGKGRILEALDNFKGHNLDYYAYDISNEHSEICRSKLNSKYGKSDVRYFSKIEEIKEKFDVILMCNVLHEISPVQWLDILNDVDKTLNDNGYLLIVEDEIIPKGEVAHEFGFIILGPKEIGELFNIPEGKLISTTPDDKKYKNRLRATLIERKHLKKANQKTLLSSLEQKKNTSLEKIETLREKFSDKSENRFKLGRSQALWTSQFANASLALERLKKQSK